MCIVLSPRYVTATRSIIFIPRKYGLSIVLSLLCVTASAQDAKEEARESQIKFWLSKQDPNKDGRIAKDEAKGLMKQFFGRNDSNQDGFLDRPELEALVDRMEKNC